MSNPAVRRGDRKHGRRAGRRRRPAPARPRRRLRRLPRRPPRRRARARAGRASRRRLRRARRSGGAPRRGARAAASRRRRAPAPRGHPVALRHARLAPAGRASPAPRWRSRRRWRWPGGSNHKPAGGPGDGDGWRGQVTRVSRAGGGGGGLTRCDAAGQPCAPIEKGGDVAPGSRLRTDEADAGLPAPRRRIAARPRSLDRDRLRRRRPARAAGARRHRRRRRPPRDGHGALRPAAGTRRGARHQVRAAGRRRLDLGRRQPRRGQARRPPGAQRHGARGRRGANLQRPAARRRRGARPGARRWCGAKRRGQPGGGDVRARPRRAAREEAGHATASRIARSASASTRSRCASPAWSRAPRSTRCSPTTPTTCWRASTASRCRPTRRSSGWRSRSTASWSKARSSTATRGGDLARRDRERRAPRARSRRRRSSGCPGPWRDPALLEWQRGGRFELRIFPIPRRGSRRVVLAYTQTLSPAGGMRRYTYPLAHDPAGSTRVDRFDIDVQVRGHDPKLGVRAYGYPLGASARPTTARRCSPGRRAASCRAAISRSCTRPRTATRELSAWAVPRGRRAIQSTAAMSADGSYVAIALRPRLPRVEENARRDFVLVVDSSRSMFGESYQRAIRLATRFTARAGSADRVTVLACDSQCRALPGGLVAPGPETAARIGKFLAGDHAGRRVRRRGRDRGARPRRRGNDGGALRLVYFGDGAPDDGAGAARVGHARRRAGDPGRPRHRHRGRDRRRVGPADAGRARARRRRRRAAVRARPDDRRGGVRGARRDLRQRAARRDADAARGAARGRAAQARHHPAGSEAFVVARLAGAEASGTIVLRGKLGGATSSSATRSASPRRRRGQRVRAAAVRGGAHRRSRARRRARGEAADAGAVRRFNVASRYTSLLVLESAAMFRAFGLDNARTTPEWTGEEASRGDDRRRRDCHGGWGRERSARGPGGGGLGGRSRREPRPNRPRPAKGSMDDRPSGAMQSEAAAIDGSTRERKRVRRARSRRTPISDFEIARERSATTRTAQSDSARREPAAEDREADGGGRAAAGKDRRWRWRAPAADDPDAADSGSGSGIVSVGRLEPRAAGRTAIASLESRLARRREPARPGQAPLHAAHAGRRRRAGGRRRRALDGQGAARSRGAARARRRRRPPAAIATAPSACSAASSRSAPTTPRHRDAWRACGAGRADPSSAAGRCRRSPSCTPATPRASWRPSAARGAPANTSWRTICWPRPSRRRRARIQALLDRPEPDDDGLRGDLRVEATWSGGGDLDLAILDPRGQRVSWFGGPTRATLSARDAVSAGREALALRGARAGEYVSRDRPRAGRRRRRRRRRHRPRRGDHVGGGDAAARPVHAARPAHAPRAGEHHAGAAARAALDGRLPGGGVRSVRPGDRSRPHDALRPLGRQDGADDRARSCSAGVDGGHLATHHRDPAPPALRPPGPAAVRR